MSEESNERERDDTLSSLAYFWQYKGDIELWSGFDRAKLEKHAPQVLAAWDAYKRSARLMDFEIKALPQIDS